jgi:hypothetical protein
VNFRIKNLMTLDYSTEEKKKVTLSAENYIYAHRTLLISLTKFK